VGKSAVSKDDHPGNSEPFELQLFKHPALAVSMKNQPLPAKEPPKQQESAEPGAAATSIAAELDQYSAEVLEAVLGILRAQRQTERRQG